ncbi:MAG: hypothetical protein WC876_06970 [Candidatus Thermoplasmatota archaeon]
MALGVGVLAILAVAVVTLLVAALVLFLDFNQRVHRAFALFLVLRAMMDGMLVISQDAGPGERLRMYWFIAVPFAALHFCLAYRRRHGRASETRPAWFAPFAILAVALVFEGLYLVDHDLFAGPPDYGPFSSFQAIRFLAFAAVSWVFAAEYRHSRSTSGRRALLMASVGFLMTPLYVCSFELGVRAIQGSLGWTLADAYYFVALLLVADAGRRLILEAAPRVRVALATVFMSWLVLAAVTAAVFFGTKMASWSTENLRILSALSALAVPLCITYALVRHRLFNAEVKLRFAVKGSTVATVFLAVFFVVSQLAQNFLSTTGGLVAGGVVTGLVLFAINPLQHWADRLAHRAVPGAHVRKGSHAERVQIYREQLEVAWSDGRLTAKERLLFARLQERLGLSAAEATRLETEVLSALGARSPGRRASPA